MTPSRGTAIVIGPQLFFDCYIYLWSASRRRNSNRILSPIKFVKLELMKKVNHDSESWNSNRNLSQI
jgi:hypothetical protein